MVGVVAIILAVHDIPLARHLAQVERDRLVTQYERDAFILAGKSEESLDSGTTHTNQELIARVQRYAAAEGVEVVITDSRSVAQISSDASKVDSSMDNRAEVAAAIRQLEPQVGQRYSSTLGSNLFYVAVPVLSGDHVVGAVRISSPEGVVNDRIRSRLTGLGAVAAISLLMTVFVAWVIARSVTKPIDDLEDVTNRLAEGHLAARASIDEGPPEVIGLARSFNTMAGRLQQLVDRQRAFAGDASHQLRTPLTALRLRLEQLSSQLGDRPAEADAVQDALDETDRLRRMIEGLLALSRAEGSSAGVVAVDVAQIAQERVEYWQPLAEEREVEMVYDGVASAPGTAIEGAVEQVVDNLVDNALDVSPPGSRLTVRVSRDENRIVEIHVIDEGPGLSTDDRSHAFERFWRSPQASAGGSGLGLAIVDQLVSASGGTRELAAAPSGGVDAVVRFPARKSLSA